MATNADTIKRRVRRFAIVPISREKPNTDSLESDSMSKNAKKQSTPLRAIPRLARFLSLAPMPADWKGVDDLMPILERLRADGAVVMMKLDGERTAGSDQGPYTALITGQVLAGEFFRSDQPTMEQALSEVVIAYAKSRWGFDPDAK